MLLDLHTSLSLRNSGNRRIRGVTLLVMAQEVTHPEVKLRFPFSSLNVGPGENFPGPASTCGCSGRCRAAPVHWWRSDWTECCLKICPFTVPISLTRAAR